MYRHSEGIAHSGEMLLEEISLWFKSAEPLLLLPSLQLSPSGSALTHIESWSWNKGCGSSHERAPSTSTRSHTPHVCMCVSYSSGDRGLCHEHPSALFLLLDAPFPLAGNG